MIDFIKVVNEPPIVEFNYSISNLAEAFDKQNTIGNYSFGSRNMVFDVIHNMVFDVTHKEKNTLADDFDKFKKVIIEKLLELDANTRYHRVDLDKLCNNLHLTVIPLIDKQGYGLGWHLDHRLIFANGILNIIDNQSHTEFSYTADGTQKYHTISGLKNTCTFWLSTEKSWHRLKDLDQDRYIIAFSLIFYK